MAWFLVNAPLRPERLPELEDMLRRHAFHSIQPQGNEIQRSLSHARLDAQGRVWWEEQCFCSPPLTTERKLAFDRYFSGVEIDKVQQGEGWHTIDEMPFLFPQLYQE